MKLSIRPTQSSTAHAYIVRSDVDAILVDNIASSDVIFRDDIGYELSYELRDSSVSITKLTNYVRSAGLQITVIP